MRLATWSFFSAVIAVSLMGCGSSESSLQQTQADAEQDLKLTEIIASVQGKDLVSRLDKASAALLDTPYQGGPLGEGDERGPLYRSNAFDCTTLVETVLAIANAKSFDDFKRLMNVIRYKDATPTFLSRNHQPDADWIDNNVARGFFQDVTKDVAAKASLGTHVSTADIDRKAWFKLFWKIDAEFAVQTKDLTYIAIGDLFKKGPELDAAIEAYRLAENDFIARIKEPGVRDAWRQHVLDLKLESLVNADAFAKIPSGSIVNLVTPGRKLTTKVKNPETMVEDVKVVTGINIGHQAMIFQSPKGLVVRDASLTWRKVTDTPIANYFFIKFTSATQKGINLLKPTEYDVKAVP